MPRIQPIPPDQATARARQRLDGVQATLGRTPNLMKTLAHSPAVLDAYLGFSGALPAKFREQIALTVAQANSCEYCLSAHSALGRLAGLNPAELLAARQAHSQDPKTAAGLAFAQTLVFHRGLVNDSALAAVRTAGFNDAEISEIVAAVAVNLFTNYFNHVAQTEVDFPRVSLEVQ